MNRPPKPIPPKVQPDNIPGELKARNQWVVWRYKWKAPKNRPGKWDKPPLDAATSSPASSTDPETWNSFEVAFAAYCAGGYDGIGYVFSGGDDDFVGVDIDHCRDPQTGQTLAWTPEQRTCEHWAKDAPEPQEIIDSLPTYAEVSPSRAGVKIFAKAKIVKAIKHGSVEMYSRGRYFTVTGHKLASAPSAIKDCNEALAAVYPKFNAKDGANRKPRAPEASGTLTNQSSPAANSAIPTLEQVMAGCENARNGDKFRRLFGGDTSGYSSQSEADLALCGIVAYWSAGQASLIDAVIRQSKLFRNKWDELHGDQTYGQRTIAVALDRCSNSYDWSRPREKKDTSYSISDLTLALKDARTTPTKLIAQIEVRKNGEAIDLFDLTSASSNREKAIERIRGHLDDPFAVMPADVDAMLGTILVAAAKVQTHRRSGRTIYTILAEHVRASGGFVYRTHKGTAYSNALNRDLNRNSFIEYFLNNAVVELATEAVDAPREENGETSRSRLISRVEQELRIVWSETTKSLPTMEKAQLDENSPAGREFHQAIIAAWHKPCQMGIHKPVSLNKDTVQLATSNSLVSRVRQREREQLLHSDRWEPVHEAYGAYCRLHVGGDGEIRVLLAMRYELLKQTGIVALDVTDQTSFRELGEKFNAIDPKPPVCDKMNRGRLRLAVLTAAVADKILAEPLVDAEASPVDAAARSVDAPRHPPRQRENETDSSG